MYYLRFLQEIHQLLHYRFCTSYFGSDMKLINSSLCNGITLVLLFKYRRTTLPHKNLPTRVQSDLCTTVFLITHTAKNSTCCISVCSSSLIDCVAASTSVWRCSICALFPYICFSKIWTYKSGKRNCER